MHLQPLHLPYDDPDLQSFYIQIFNHTYGEKQISEQNTFFIKEISLVIKKGLEDTILILNPNCISILKWL